ncbi:MAG: GNAT family N-acetyltransferase [Rhodoferax sp.]|nr:GNAT family N-acetyltransferase [Rhodoferax sp.]MBK9236212.1 GNAT family N-acetyltransferase [Rhodoferax sp.]
MTETRELPESIESNTDELLGLTAPRPSTVDGAKPSQSLVPIRSLGVNHRERIAEHLLDLSEHDRYLRFGYVANDEQVRRYVDKLDFARDEVFGIYNRKLELLAVAHLAYSTDAQCDACAEFGVSVAESARGRGYGGRLFDRAAMHARNDGVSLMFIHALTENTAMLKIARKAGATVERDGAESEAYLRLPPATLDTRLTELVEEQIAQTDYRIKSQAKHFWGFLAGLQALRRDVQDATRNTGS